MPYFMKEILFASASVGLALLFLFESRSLNASAAMFPRILIGVIILLAIIMSVQAIKEHKRKAGEETAPETPINYKRICVFLAILISYIALVEPLGYFVVTPVYIVAAFLYLRAVKPITAIVVSLGFTAFVFAVFVLLLHLPVPMGLFDGFM